MKPPQGRGPGNRNGGGSRHGGAPPNRTGTPAGWRGDRPPARSPANPAAPSRDDSRLHLAARPVPPPTAPRDQPPRPERGHEQRGHERNHERGPDRPRGGQPDAPR